MTEPLLIPLMQLEDRHCREVVDIGRNGLALYCGRTKSGTTSYCTHHRRLNLVMVADRFKPRPVRQKVWDF